MPAKKSNANDSRDDSSSQASMSDSDEYPQFKIGDTVEVYWSMLQPAEWFCGEVVKLGSRGIKVYYAEESSFSWHDPRKWDVGHAP